MRITNTYEAIPKLIKCHYPTQSEINNALLNYSERDQNNYPELFTLFRSILLEILPPPDWHTTAYARIQADLTEVISRNVSNYQLHIFSSRSVGLSFKGSDFDFYVSIDSRPMSVRTIVKHTSMSMEQSEMFRNVVCSMGQVKLIRCVHRTTNLNCDISFNKNRVLFNTHILRHLLHFDSRILPMTFFLKFWAKQHGVIDANRISTYCLCMLIVFYLQQLSLPILPPIIEFQEQVAPVEYGYWNLAFDMTISNRTANKMTVSELISGFFRYYRDFKFDEYIISPLYAKAYRADQFSQKIPSEMTRYSDYIAAGNVRNFNDWKGSICIQDPFEQCENVARYKPIQCLLHTLLPEATDICDAILESTSVEYSRVRFAGLFNRPI